MGTINRHGDLSLFCQMSRHKRGIRNIATKAKCLCQLSFMFVEVIRIIILKGDCRATVDQQKYEEQLMLFGLVFIKFT